jgi:glucokinase
MRVLAGDIGGTNARLAEFEARGTELQPIAEQSFASADFGGLVDLIRAFLRDGEHPIERACFGLPGPVRGRRVALTNLPWVVDADELERACAIEHVALLNDLEASGWGLATLRDDEVLQLRAGEPDPVGNGALVSAGTGLGEAGLAWDGARQRPFATEGGHCDFAPADALETELLAWLRARHGHVSWERVVSGPGLRTIHAFLCEREGVADPFAADPDRAPEAITRSALAGSDARCGQALDLFMGLYGAEAGNAALKMLATAGVWLGGGIAPKIAEALASSRFLARFDDKGRMRPLLEKIPVRVVLATDCGLRGAALCAARR